MEQIWKSSIPPKVKIFMWKLSKDVLPTKHNKFVRNIVSGLGWNFYEIKIENSYHATIAFPQVHFLWLAMRDHWSLLDETMLIYGSRLGYATVEQNARRSKVNYSAWCCRELGRCTTLHTILDQNVPWILSTTYWPCMNPCYKSDNRP